MIRNCMMVDMICGAFDSRWMVNGRMEKAPGEIVWVARLMLLAMVGAVAVVVVAALT